MIVRSEIFEAKKYECTLLARLVLHRYPVDGVSCGPFSQLKAVWVIDGPIRRKMCAGATIPQNSPQ